MPSGLRDMLALFRPADDLGNMANRSCRMLKCCAFEELLMEISRRPDLSDQLAIVTGAARGIGQACAVALAAEGANIVVADMISGEATVARVRELGRRALYVPTDVTRRDAVQEMVARTISEFGHIDILVNNAGTLGRVGIEDTTDEIWDRDMNTILRGTFYCTQLVLPHMKARRAGKIVNISSVSGK